MLQTKVLMQQDGKSRVTLIRMEEARDLYFYMRYPDF